MYYRYNNICSDSYIIRSKLRYIAIATNIIFGWWYYKLIPIATQYHLGPVKKASPVKIKL